MARPVCIRTPSAPRRSGRALGAMKTIVLHCVVLVFCGGCFFGDKVGTAKSVSVNIPSRNKGTKLSADSREVQEAVHMISELVVPYGLLRDTNAQTDHKADIAYFHDQYSRSWCRVRLEGDTLTTSLFEFGRGRAS